MSEPRRLSSGAFVRLVAGREISTRIRDKGFIISSLVIVLLLVGIIGFNVAVNSGSDKTRLAVVGETATLEPALQAQGKAFAVEVTVVRFDDEQAARAAVEDGAVDGALLDGTGDRPELVVKRSTGGPMEAAVTNAVAQVDLGRLLARAGVSAADVPKVTVTSIKPNAEQEQQRVIIAIIGVGVLYGLLLMFGNFVAQGVVEEKSSRVVELLLATMRPWQLLAGKILGLGILGLAQIVLIGVVGVTGAIAFDVIDVPGDLVGTVVTVVAWFVLGYALYAALFAAAASLVSRQEDLGSAVTPMTILLVAGFIIAVQATSDPSSTLATVTSYIPGVSSLVMPVRQAAGEAAPWEVGVSVLLMLVAIALVVRLGGRIYAGALLRTGGKTKLREALKAERA